MQVRLVGIDAPDFQQQPWGQAAKERLEAMIGGRPVLLEFDVQGKDAFERRLYPLYSHPTFIALAT